MTLIQIYDTTLRDGTQSEGFNLSANDKLRIAKRLDDFGVAFIEGGWPGSNPKDVEFFERARDMEWKTPKSPLLAPPVASKAARKTTPASRR
jgi:2-isopropylmalate synthase